MANPTVSSIATQGLQFYDTLQAQQNAAFQGNQAALNMVSKTWAPIMQTGAVPYGYSAGLDSLLRSNIINESAAGTTNAINAEQLKMQQQGGGAQVLPTGANAQIEAATQATGAQGEASSLAAEKEAGYEQGLKNVEGGTQAELGVASNENETGLGSAATGAGNLALNAGNTQFEENQVSSPMNIAKGILGDIGQGASDIAGGVAPGIAGVLGQFSSPTSAPNINGATASLPITPGANSGTSLY